MPKLGLTMATGTIARWLKRAGDAVTQGEPLVEVSTDKISYEIESPASGILARTFGNDGDDFACGVAIGTIALAADGAPPVQADPERDSVAATSVLEAPRIPPGAGARIIASPAARRLARERNVPLVAVRGTGPRGRITLSDVYAHLPSPAAPASLAAAASLALPDQLPAGRRAIFRKMDAVGRLPLAQVEANARVDAVKDLQQLRGDFGWTAFSVCALARLLREHPALRIDARSGAVFTELGIGIAVDTPQGLIVPVVRDADLLSLAEIEVEVQRLASRARDGGLAAADVSGACFSLSNLGPQRVERVSPLPDPPQTAILGIGAATQRPAVVDGTVAIAWMMTCVLTFDHRFIDGAPAARFLAGFVDACANPGRLL